MSARRKGKGNFMAIARQNLLRVKKGNAIFSKVVKYDRKTAHATLVSLPQVILNETELRAWEECKGDEVLLNFIPKTRLKVAGWIDKHKQRDPQVFEIAGQLKKTRNKFMEKFIDCLGLK